MSSVAQLEPEIPTEKAYLITTPFYRKSIIDRALKSFSTPCKLAMMILFFLMSSVAQLEPEIPNPIYFQKNHSKTNYKNKTKKDK